MGDSLVSSFEKKNNLCQEFLWFTYYPGLLPLGVEGNNRGKNFYENRQEAIGKTHKRKKPAILPTARHSSLVSCFVVIIKHDDFWQSVYISYIRKVGKLARTGGANVAKTGKREKGRGKS
jgi:hypothetical protein